MTKYASNYDSAIQALRVTVPARNGSLTGESTALRNVNMPKGSSCNPPRRFLDRFSRLAARTTERITGFQPQAYSSPDSYNRIEKKWKSETA